MSEKDPKNPAPEGAPPIEKPTQSAAMTREEVVELLLSQGWRPDLPSQASLVAAIQQASRGIDSASRTAEAALKLQASTAAYVERSLSRVEKLSGEQNGNLELVAANSQAVVDGLRIAYGQQFEASQTALTSIREATGKFQRIAEVEIEEGIEREGSSATPRWWKRVHLKLADVTWPLAVRIGVWAVASVTALWSWIVAVPWIAEAIRMFHF